MAFDSTDKAIGIDVDIAEGERGGVAEANAVLVFRFIVRESLCVFLYDEPARASRGVGENRVGIGDSAIADPLLVAVDLVADDLAPPPPRLCSSPDRAELAAGFGLG